MLDYKIIIGIISVLITILGYYIYIKDIFHGKNRPHFFSWFIWGIITLFIYIIQFSGNPGAGSWVILFTLIFTFFIAILSLFRGTKDITFSDLISFSFALIAIGLWFLIADKIFALLLLVLIDIFAYYPTFRKSWKNPFEENYILYLLSIPKFGLAILALEKINLITSLYLFVNFIILFFLVFLILFKRKQVTANKEIIINN